MAQTTLLEISCTGSNTVNEPVQDFKTDHIGDISPELLLFEYTKYGSR